MPPDRYPSTQDMRYYVEFTVPPLPSEPGGTYYIYYNMFFDPDGYDNYNQFVPQLMLGGTLCGDHGPPDYTPVWCDFSSWHIGSQYFFTTNSHSTAHAVTGEAIAVDEGDTVYTSMSLSEDDWTWTLNIGIKGTDRMSTVTVDRPFMGLMSGDASWNATVYNTAYIGCDWELYALYGADSFPKYMDYAINVSSTQPRTFWKDWQMRQSSGCKDQPRATSKSAVSKDQKSQIVAYDIGNDGQ